MPEVRLTPTSYVVLGLIEQLQPATPYDLKQAAAVGVARFWSLPHTQLYSEPERLALAGYLTEKREQEGRRRRIYRLTPPGKRALDQWRSEPTHDLYELRDAGLLKLYFGADPAKVAAPQLQAHTDRLNEYEALLEESRRIDAPAGVRLAIEAGIGHAREYVRFWSRLAERG
jgi:DNA-binding PadR family transcriptional regulator